MLRVNNPDKHRKMWVRITKSTIANRKPVNPGDVIEVPWMDGLYLKGHGKAVDAKPKRGTKGTDND